jgi:abhydrolase domain-containing protein 1/3
MESLFSPSVLSFILTTTGIKLSITFFRLARKKPVILMEDTATNQSLVKSCPSLHNFRPTLLYCLDYYGTLQTIGQTLLRNFARIFSKIKYRRELFVLSDHGTVGLDWVESYKGQICSYDSKAPTVIMMHGLCGDSNAEYLVHLVEVLVSRGYRVVVMVARGCGNVPLTTSVPFNGARTLDYKECVDYVHSLYPESPLFGMGFSLGACLLLRYFSDYNEPHTNPLLGGIAVSPPWDFHVKASVLFELVWTRLLVFLLKHYTLVNSRALKELFWNSLLKSFTIRDFDAYACKYSGYSDVEEYYRDCTLSNKLHKIQTPLLAVSSVDDPICNVEGCPREVNKFGKGLITVIVEHGGHLGFAEHIFPLNSSWIDRLTVEYFSSLLALSKE